ncbi:MAG: serine hydrolase, partial [Gemmatimonadetes bacterium]|nr:serine hydrolase [Gemmatimonadota bacterium]
MVRLKGIWLLTFAVAVGGGACGGDGGGTGPDMEPPTGTPVLSVLSGDDQTDQAGGTLWQDVVVRVTNESGATFAGVSVQAAVSGGGTVTPASATSDAQGQASFRWTLGDQLGAQDLEFTAAGATPVEASAWALENLPTFDSHIEAFLTQWGVPGVGVAVAFDGRLVYARGYGVADVGTGEDVKAEHRFRIASVSKPITAAAVMQMVERGELDLEDPAFDYLDHLDPPAGATPDSRLADITIRNLLEHAGGWDRDASFDPMFIPQQAADGVSAPAPASAETVIRFMLGQSLDFDPAARYAYSNFGYAVLGRIIESVSGTSYEDYMTSQFLAPMGITRMA